MTLEAPFFLRILPRYSARSRRKSPERYTGKVQCVGCGNSIPCCLLELIDSERVTETAGDCSSRVTCNAGQTFYRQPSTPRSFNIVRDRQAPSTSQRSFPIGSLPESLALQVGSDFQSCTETAIPGTSYQHFSHFSSSSDTLRDFVISSVLTLNPFSHPEPY